MAMTLQDYEERIANNENKLAKIEKRIQKWNDAKSDEKFAKHFDWMKASENSWSLGWDGTTRRYGTFEEFKARNYPDWEKECEQEIKYALSDKEDTINTITKYKNSIELLKEKDAKPVIQIFKDFFNRWKDRILEYVKPLVDEYYEINNKKIKLANSRWRPQNVGFETREELDDEYKKLHEEEKELLSEPIVRTAIDKRLRRDPKEFIKYLDDYMNDRYFELVDKVTAIVGEINDVTQLSVGRDGTLNGRIYGDKGGAKIETIVAGGNRVHEIVNVKHGQIRHFRVLVHPIK